MSVGLGCYHKISWTGWLINSRNSFLSVLDSSKSKIKVSADLVSAEGPLPFPFASHGGRGKDILWGLFYEGTNLIYGGSTLVISLPLKNPAPNTITLGIRFQNMNFGRMQTFRP